MAQGPLAGERDEPRTRGVFVTTWWGLLRRCSVVRIRGDVGPHDPDHVADGLGSVEPTPSPVAVHSAVAR
ncbi:hypothetical protein [Blastococcus brunescens]|uniref:Uncharacterized protein n=1 Tax=Blastococcus brunescens TaxID=1564165 RepID=A0ABZ1B4P1_9ACTN|nr:hypothetical protein [Blastococcus sp. BMG 8361]WRL65767.1 hypothetical protein U6N30_09425 [Blastococcus sp. BMG 8361]